MKVARQALQVGSTSNHTAAALPQMPPTPDILARQQENKIVENFQEVETNPCAKCCRNFEQPKFTRVDLDTAHFIVWCQSDTFDKVDGFIAGLSLLLVRA